MYEEVSNLIYCYRIHYSKIEGKAPALLVTLNSEAYRDFMSDPKLRGHLLSSMKNPLTKFMDATLIVSHGQEEAVLIWVQPAGLTRNGD